MAGGLLGRRDPAVVARIVGGHRRVGIAGGEGLHLGGGARHVTGLGRETAADEMSHGLDGRIRRIALGGLQCQLGVHGVVHPRVDVGDGGAIGRHFGADTGMGLGVGDDRGAPGGEVPGQGVHVLVVELRSPPRTTARRRAQGLPGLPGAFLVRHGPCGVDHVVIGDPVVGLELERRQIERQRVAG